MPAARPTMKHLPRVGLAAALALATTATPAVAAQTAGEPDVVLDVPTLHIDELDLDVQNLDAHLSLKAELLDLLLLNAGVDLTAQHIGLRLAGVDAEAHLVVRLDTVARIIDRVLTSIDRNPQLITGLLRTVGGLLSQTINTLGQTVLRTVTATGSIVERVVDQSGTIVSQQVVGSVLDLPVISESTNAAGQTVRLVRDASGTVIELVLDAAGNILNVRVISQATGGAG